MSIAVGFNAFDLTLDSTPITGEEFDLVVTAKNSDGSVDTDYDGSIYFQVL